MEKGKSVKVLNPPRGMVMSIGEKENLRDFLKEKRNLQQALEKQLLMFIYALPGPARPLSCCGRFSASRCVSCGCRCARGGRRPRCFRRCLRDAGGAPAALSFRCRPLVCSCFVRSCARCGRWSRRFRRCLRDFGRAAASAGFLFCGLGASLRRRSRCCSSCSWSRLAWTVRGPQLPLHRVPCARCARSGGGSRTVAQHGRSGAFCVSGSRGVRRGFRLCNSL